LVEPTAVASRVTTSGALDPSVVVVMVVEVVVGPHGQSRDTAEPTAALKQSSASVAFTGSVPLGAQMHSGEQVAESTATWRMNKQSLAVGKAPEVSG
jgi:hypothetical protein